MSALKACETGSSTKTIFAKNFTSIYCVMLASSLEIRRQKSASRRANAKLKKEKKKGSSLR